MPDPDPFADWTNADRDALRGIYNHYLMSTEWAAREGKIQPGVEVVARRDLCLRILGTLER